jgi:RNA polymerase sigma-70 factor, ECF subfamily
MSAVEALPSQSLASPPSLAARDAAHGLFERHQSRILGFCVRRLSTREEAEDAVQTVFVNALRALQRGVVPISEEAWLFKIAENVCRETHRANGRRRLREVSEPEDLADPVAGDAVVVSDTARELIAALDTLPGNQRRALLLREWRGLSYKEIATDLRCTLGAVETLIFRARRNMAQALSQTKTRIAGLLDFGSLVGALKAMFGGATVAKVAAAAVVVTVATLPAGDAPLAAATKQVAVLPTPAKEMPSAVTTSGGRAVVPRTVAGSRADRQTGDTQSSKGKTAPPGSRKVIQGAPAQSQPGASGEAPAIQAPVAPNPQQTPLITPPSVQVPPPPVVEVPQVPELPELPVELPELPTEIQVPELPVPPELPVQLPSKIEVPQLPKLP